MKFIKRLFCVLWGHDYQGGYISLWASDKKCGRCNNTLTCKACKAERDHQSRFLYGPDVKTRMGDDEDGK